MKFFYSILFFLAGSALFANLPADTFKLANDAFDKGSIDDAIQLYESIVHSKYASVVLYYNLGTAYIEKKKWAEARFYLEKALLLNPLHDEVKHNLNYVQEQIDDLYQFPYFPLTNLIEYIHGKTGWGALSLALLVVFLLFLVGIWVKPLHWKTGSYTLAGLWVVLLGLFLLERNYADINSYMGIVWQNEVDLREKPDELSNTIASLSAGFKVRILEQVGPWCRVDLADGSTGWLLEDSIKLLVQETPG